MIILGSAPLGSLSSEDDVSAEELTGVGVLDEWEAGTGSLIAEGVLEGIGALDELEAGVGSFLIAPTDLLGSPALDIWVAGTGRLLTTAAPVSVCALAEEEQCRAIEFLPETAPCVEEIVC